MPIKSFRDLRIWQEAHALTLRIYKVTERFPPMERFALTSQMRRSASSVPANIAEGMGRKTLKDLSHFLTIARGSVQETLYHCILARDLGYVTPKDAAELERRYNGLSAGIQSCRTRLAQSADRATHAPPLQNSKTP